MHKLIPTIYFYLLSIVGVVLIIIGVFNAIHFIVGTTLYKEYPLQYGTPYERCEQMGKPVEPTVSPQEDKAAQERCYRSLEEERLRTKTNDLEQAVAYTLIGSVVFGIHFFFARRKTSQA